MKTDERTLDLVNKLEILERIGFIAGLIGIVLFGSMLDSSSSVFTIVCIGMFLSLSALIGSYSISKYVSYLNNTSDFVFEDDVDNIVLDYFYEYDAWLDENKLTDSDYNYSYFCKNIA